MIYEIFNDKKEFVNAISADEDFVVNYCKENNYTFSLRESFENLDALRMDKIIEIKEDCERYINNGSDIKFPTGVIKHFTYNLADQSNISEMFTAIMAGATEYPYHADGEICKIYTKEQIVAIYGTLSLFKTEATTYHNSLKAQIKAMTDADAILATKFKETELTGEYLTNYNEMMASAQTQLNAILAKIPTDEAV